MTDYRVVKRRLIVNGIPRYEYVVQCKSNSQSPFVDTEWSSSTVDGAVGFILCLKEPDEVVFP